jgi:hypothetical protein
MFARCDSGVIHLKVQSGYTLRTIFPPLHGCGHPSLTIAHPKRVDAGFFGARRLIHKLMIGDGVLDEVDAGFFSTRRVILAGEQLEADRRGPEPLQRRTPAR